LPASCNGGKNGMRMTVNRYPNGKREAGDGQWATGSGQRVAGSGQRATGDGQRVLPVV